MSSELVKVDVGTELILPQARNDGAAGVIRKLPAVLQQLPGGIERAAWAAAVVAEANAIDANPQSVMKCVYNLAFLGLFPGSALGHAYFVPFKGQATLVVGYRGFTELAYESGFLSTVHADVMCDGEHIELWTDEDGQHLKHVPNINRVPARNNIIAAYCIYRTKDGGRGLVVCNREDLKRSDKQRDVWNSNYPAMCMKTAIRRASKTWRLTRRLAHAVQIDEQAEREELQALPADLRFDDEPVAATGYKLPVGDE